jgi:hypothetical protein
MIATLMALLVTLRATVPSRLALSAEVLALGHQLGVLQRQAPHRPRLRSVDRLLWVLLPRVWPGWRRAVRIVTPDTVVERTSGSPTRRSRVPCSHAPPVRLSKSHTSAGCTITTSGAPPDAPRCDGNPASGHCLCVNSS